MMALAPNAEFTIDEGKAPAEPCVSAVQWLGRSLRPPKLTIIRDYTLRAELYQSAIFCMQCLCRTGTASSESWRRELQSMKCRRAVELQRHGLSDQSPIVTMMSQSFSNGLSNGRGVSTKKARGNPRAFSDIKPSNCEDQLASGNANGSFATGFTMAPERIRLTGTRRRTTAPFSRT